MMVLVRSPTKYYDLRKTLGMLIRDVRNITNSIETIIHIECIRCDGNKQMFGVISHIMASETIRYTIFYR